MGARYLTDLANVVRGAGLDVVEEPGWQTRARGSGGFESGRPTHFMVHHTASNPASDGQADVNYIAYGSPDEPICQLYLNRAGRCWVVAAGACNTNGTGHDWWGGGVPDDSMNTWALACEVANTGVGEPYPQAQQEALGRLVGACCRAYNIPTHHVRTHFEWTDRKCDNTGPARWSSGAGGCNGAGAWAMDWFRADIAAGWPGATHPPIPPIVPQEDAAVDYIRVYRNSSEYVVFRRSGNALTWMTRAMINAEQASYQAAGLEVPEETKSNANVTDLLACYVLIGPPPPEWPPVSAFLGHVET